MNIWWIRRDLRLSDNQALTAALREGSGVIPLFILDDHLLEKPAENRQAFLFEGLRELDRSLRKLGSKLILRRGDPKIEIPRFAIESGSHRFFAEADVTPYSIQRDHALEKLVDLHLVNGLGVHPTPVVTRPDGQPYTVFTPYSRAWKSLPFNDHTLPAPEQLLPVPDLASEEIPESPETNLFKAGEIEARRRLETFLGGPIYEYGTGRDLLDRAGTSSLSPYLRFGMLSATQAASAARKAVSLAPDAQSRSSAETWLNELIWREFYQSILYHFPFVLKMSFRQSMRSIPWRNSPQDLHAWQAGLTGYPVVDAGMRQLRATGWMHNRARMITASFLVKHLLINWQEGEKWFMLNLVDGDPAANNGGWQWTAGTGTDAAPYFRIFNPILQGLKFDPEGNYIKRWVPELINVPQNFIHKPWEMTATEQSLYQTRIGKKYPAPIVDHAFARQRALMVYGSS